MSRGLYKIEVISVGINELGVLLFQLLIKSEEGRVVSFD